MSDAPPSVVRPYSSLSPEEVLNARARAWSFVFRCWKEKQRTACSGSPHDQLVENGEVSNVERSTDEASNIDPFPFSKENE